MLIGATAYDIIREDDGGLRIRGSHTLHPKHSIRFVLRVNEDHLSTYAFFNPSINLPALFTVDPLNQFLA